MTTEQTQSSNGPVIGLLGHTGNCNLGDEAITEAVIQNFKKRLPGVRFKIFSIHPDDSAQRYNCEAFPLRPAEDATVSSIMYRNWQPLKGGEDKNNRHALAPLHERKGWPYTAVEWRPSIKQRIRRLLNVITGLPALLRNELAFGRRNRELLDDVDLMVFTGSNQFLDNFGGPWAFPFTLLRWSRLAKKTGTPLAYASVGAGPIYSKLSLWLINRALRYASYISVRDEPSRELLIAGGCTESINVCPDLAFSLVEKQDNNRQFDAQKPTIGINPMPVYSSSYWYVADEVLYQNYVNALAEFALYLKGQNFSFFFFATQTKDENVMVDVFATMEKQSGEAVDKEALVRHSDAVSELTDIIDTADVVVATRFHGTVLGLYAEKPVIGTCYYRKSADLLEENGLHDFILPLEELEQGQLEKRFDRVLQEYQMRTKQIKEVRAEYRQQLETQYSRLCDLIP